LRVPALSTNPVTEQDTERVAYGEGNRFAHEWHRLLSPDAASR